MYQEEYKGHQITVSTLELANGWVAAYQVDVGKIHRCDGRPLPDEEIVRQEAISEAKLLIDQMAE